MSSSLRCPRVHRRRRCAETVRNCWLVVHGITSGLRPGYEQFQHLGRDWRMRHRLAKANQTGNSCWRFKTNWCQILTFTSYRPTELYCNTLPVYQIEIWNLLMNRIITTLVRLNRSTTAHFVFNLHSLIWGFGSALKCALLLAYSSICNRLAEMWKGVLFGPRFCGLAEQGTWRSGIGPFDSPPRGSY